MKKEKSLPKEVSNIVTIIPLKNHVILQNEFHYNLVEGQMIDIDTRFLEVLLMENVISNKG